MYIVILSTQTLYNDNAVGSLFYMLHFTWWKRNATSNEPVARISTDSGKTFGPILKLGANGTIGFP
jgi:hypothetical protein